MNLISIFYYLCGNIRRTLLFVLFFALVKPCFGQAPNISYPTPQVYTVNTPITPLIPTNSGGAVLANSYGFVSTFAGNGLVGSTNATGTAASFNAPQSITIDAAGNLYVPEYYNKIIRKITPAGVVTTFAGILNTPGTTNGPLTVATFLGPTSAVFDSGGNMFIADYAGHTIRKITPAGIMSTFAGSGTAGFINGTGTGARFNQPYGLAIDANDNLYVADLANNAIRKINPAGVVTTLAGNGTKGQADGTGAAARFTLPGYLTVDAAGNIYVSDGGNNAIRKVTPAGVVTTIAGVLPGVPAALANIGIPGGIKIKAAGDIYFASLNKNQIFKITAAGALVAIAGNSAGISGSADGTGDAATFNRPQDVAIDAEGNLYIADQNNNLIRKVNPTGYTIDLPPPAGIIFDSLTGTFSGTPTAASPATNYIVTAHNGDGMSSTVVNITVNANSSAPPAIAAPNISYVTPQNYDINVPITPLAPNNTGGAVPATVYGQVSTFASGGFNASTAVGVDADYVYVDDWGNNQIKKINILTGQLTTMAGTGNVGANNGPGNTATFYEPDGIITDGAGNLYIGDQGNNLIRKITPAGQVSTFAGSGLQGSADGSSTSASFYNPRGLAIDPAGNIYVADQGNNLIRKITPAGVVSTVAGHSGSGFINATGTAASFSTPTGVGIDAAGNLYVADAGNSAIRKISPAGVVTTFATGLNFPREIRIDGSGNCYVTEQNSNSIKRISPTGVITAIATNGNFNGPIGLILDGRGNLYVADSGNNLIKKIIVSGYTIDKPLPAGLSFDITTGIISGTPTALTPSTPYSITAYNGGGSSTTIVNIGVITLQVTPTVITFSNPASRINPDNTITIFANSNNTETSILFTSSDPSIIFVDANNVLHILAPGTTTITASQAATTHFTAGTAIQIQNIKRNQFVVFPAIANKLTCDVDFSTAATSQTSSLFPIKYLSSNTAVATVDDSGLVHIVGAGTTTITASEPGDNNLYNDAAPKSQTLTVTAPVAPLVTVTPNAASVCQGLPVTFTANVSNLGTLTNPGYQWLVNGINAGTNNASFSTNTITGTDVIKCIVTNNAACPATGSGTYTGVTVIPSVTFSANINSTASGPVCAGTPVTFTATSNQVSTTYQWHINGVDVGSNSATYTSSNFADGDKVTCTFTDLSTLCLTPPVLTSPPVTVNIISPASPAPTVTITASANSVYAGNPVTFTATVINPVSNINYQWQVNGINAGTNSGTFTTSSLSNADKITCTISSNTSCMTPATSLPLAETVLPPPVVTPPNTFTPNGDGINDSWQIAGLNTYPNCEVTVYNRFGTRLYQSKGYSKSWDGTINDHILPAGTYYYVIDLNNNTPKISGYVALIR
ncbi:gliding motility-associated C-terminal domain-containing protein [Mucilaginibacter sp. UR6-11]|uniref:T9SS type B sorting domain-containing protein n=1 Tax=Mucilaginibacter sp. UR6-11 TaxID=1435644 RepID=UPI001E5F8825|nr:gliding motility-associated C-terminal domain-containing protein [Mucilaginibacter sp. UR6-11]MCC8424806.1 gliding motility-associated C-terminal domain-containing protein [Mucilaginibacter sp. UR6-11]